MSEIDKNGIDLSHPVLGFDKSPLKDSKGKDLVVAEQLAYVLGQHSESDQTKILKYHRIAGELFATKILVAPKEDVEEIKKIVANSQIINLMAKGEILNSLA